MIRIIFFFLYKPIDGVEISDRCINIVIVAATTRPTAVSHDLSDSAFLNLLRTCTHSIITVSRKISIESTSLGD